MSYRIGIVKKIEPGGYAQIITERKTVCGECNHKKVICYGCLLSPRIVGRVANPVSAGVGDIVNVYLSSKKLFLAAALFYIVPMATLLFGAVAGMFISGAFSISEDAASISGAAAGLLLGSAAVTFVGRHKTIGRFFDPSITAIVKKNVLEETLEEQHAW